MHQQEYIQAVEEMKIPASKALEWANIIAEKYCHHYNEPDRESGEYVREKFDNVAEACKQLVDMIPQIQENLDSDQIDSANTLEIFVHTLAGPLMTMSSGTKIILLLPFGDPKKNKARMRKNTFGISRKSKLPLNIFQHLIEMSF